MLGIMKSRLIARGYLEALIVPAFATEIKAKSAATDTTRIPTFPNRVPATVATGDKSPANLSIGITDTITAVPIP